MLFTMKCKSIVVTQRRERKDHIFIYFKDPIDCGTHITCVSTIVDHPRFAAVVFLNPLLFKKIE